ncbi:MAG: hypothetical protein GY874_22260 [Desulfobacteraceae bacterium]|nr:hypothetical protein [Desulfobacteraceae bacterium]
MKIIKTIAYSLEFVSRKRDLNVVLIPNIFSNEFFKYFKTLGILCIIYLGSPFLTVFFPMHVDVSFLQFFFEEQIFNLIILFSLFQLIQQDLKLSLCNPTVFFDSATVDISRLNVSPSKKPKTGYNDTEAEEEAKGYGW